MPKKDESAEEVPLNGVNALTRAQSLDAVSGLATGVDQTLDAMLQEYEASTNRMLSVASVLKDHADTFLGANDFRSYFKHRVIEKWPDIPTRPTFKFDSLTTWFGYAATEWGQVGMGMLVNSTMTENVIEWLFAQKHNTPKVTAVDGNGSPLLRSQVITEAVYREMLEQAQVLEGPESKPQRNDVVREFEERALSSLDQAGRLAQARKTLEKQGITALKRSLDKKQSIGDSTPDGAIANAAISALEGQVTREGIFMVAGIPFDEAVGIFELGLAIENLADADLPMPEMDDDAITKVQQIIVAALVRCQAHFATKNNEPMPEKISIDDLVVWQQVNE